MFCYQTGGPAGIQVPLAGPRLMGGLYTTGILRYHELTVARAVELPCISYIASAI